MEPIRPADQGTERTLGRGATDTAVATFPPPPPRIDPTPEPGQRVTVRGKFLWLGREKVYLRGVTYGTFAPRPDGSQYPEPGVVRGDFRDMRAAGCNAVRTYTAPPRWLLDTAQEEGLLVLVGLPWEQHITFLDDRQRARDVELRVREA